MWNLTLRGVRRGGGRRGEELPGLSTDPVARDGALWNLEDRCVPNQPEKGTTGKS